MKSRILLVAAAIAYLLSTFTVAGVVMRLTLWAYNASDRPLSETVSATVLNTSAATLLWLAFIGGFDMFFTIWQMMQNRQQAAEHQKERETWEAQREEQRKAQEEQRKAQAQTLEEQRKAQEEQRKAQEEQRKAQAQTLEEQRKVQVQTLEEQRQFQQAVLQQMATEREESRRRWEEDCRRWEADRREREEERREREQLLTGLLQTERERSDFFMARFMELAERLGNSRNGSGGGGNGKGNGNGNSNDNGAAPDGGA